MKKTWFLCALVCVICAGLLVLQGCTTMNPRTSEPNTTGQSATEAEPQNSVAASLPDVFRLTYAVGNDDGTLTLVTFARDVAGNLYYRDNTTEQWFLWQESGVYLPAEPDGSGGLTVTDPTTLFPWSYVQSISAAFWDCAGTTEKLAAPGFVAGETETVAGRVCRVYTNTLGVEGMYVIYSLYVDTETGICLGWTSDAELGAFDAGSNEGFLCTEFLTEGVRLTDSVDKT